MSEVQKVLKGMGGLGQVVCDMGFITCTVSIVTYILYGLLFPKTSLFVLKLEKSHVNFLFLCVLVSIQRTGYSIQQTVNKFLKKIKKMGKSVEKVLKKYGKSVKQEVLNI